VNLNAVADAVDCFDLHVQDVAMRLIDGIRQAAALGWPILGVQAGAPKGCDGLRVGRSHLITRTKAEVLTVGHCVVVVRDSEGDGSPKRGATLWGHRANPMRSASPLNPSRSPSR